MIGGRDRRERGFRRDYSPRSQGRSVAPPSRHLWIGNLSHHIHESALTEQCLRFGELESVAFQPGRSYAFVNFRREEDAMIAIRALQGFPLAGMPLKIEFAKAEKSLAAAMRDDYQQRGDERRSVDHRPPSQWDLREVPPSPAPFYTEKPRTGDKNAAPSEVLWIGFPNVLNVDEMLLRRAFSPFGEIEKITVFPGRTYAFVRFRTVAAACRAKEVLQGKLFDNPRVSICFSKSEKNEMNSHDQGRGSMPPPFSPRFQPNDHPGRPNEFLHDRNFGGSPHFASDLEFEDPGHFGFNRNGPVWSGPGPSGPFEPMGFMGPPRTPLRLPEDVYEYRNTPSRGPPLPHEFSPGRFPRKSPFYEDPSAMHDPFAFHEAKKLKTGPSPRDRELPEHPFSDTSQDIPFAHPPRTFPNRPEQGSLDRGFESTPFNYNRAPDRSMNFPHPPNDRSNKWDSLGDNRFETRPGFASGLLQGTSLKQKPPTPEPPHQSPPKEMWKWEGTIAKGGTPVCRARCFPVGKVSDIMLPETLDCTARTGLDMLAKHFYQAATSYVVFFVPESDADIGLYNEFMHFLGEKQRAAVAKLGEKTTLFLVPPSDFSEKVLKVPGKLSISGVILRFQDASSEIGASLNQQPLEAMDSKLPLVHENVSQPKPTPPPPTDKPSVWSSSQNYNNHLTSDAFPSTSFPTPSRQEHEIPPPHESRRYPPLPPQLPPSWQNSNPQVSSKVPVHSSDTVRQERHFPIQGFVQEASASHFSHQETKATTVPPPVSSLQPEQLAHLASLLVPKQQPGSGPVLPNPDTNSYPSSQKTPNPHTFQWGQMQQQNNNNAPTVSSQSMPSNLQNMRGTPQSQPQVNQPVRDEEANPHTRLQATLQLAATLLQQIQQQSKGPDQ
ncbi:hypothetical protein ACHQM5_023113 [Ranunculus cassubicifolius]